MRAVRFCMTRSLLRCTLNRDCSTDENNVNDGLTLGNNKLLKFEVLEWRPMISL